MGFLRKHGRMTAVEPAVFLGNYGEMYGSVRFLRKMCGVLGDCAGDFPREITEKGATMWDFSVKLKVQRVRYRWFPGRKSQKSYFKFAF